MIDSPPIVQGDEIIVAVDSSTDEGAYYCEIIHHANGTMTLIGCGKMLDTQPVDKPPVPLQHADGLVR